MKQETREFSLGLMISLTDGHLMVPFDELHEAVEWLVGYPVWTHQLTRVYQEIVKPYLENEFYSIRKIQIPDGLNTELLVENYLTYLIELGYPPSYTVFNAAIVPRPVDPLVELGEILDKRQ